MFFWLGDGDGPRPKGSLADSLGNRYAAFGLLRVRTAEVLPEGSERVIRFCNCNSGAPQKCDRITRGPPIFVSSAAADYPIAEVAEVIIDNAPWHAGEPVQKALQDNPHLELKRLPRYSSQLNVIERVWKLLRRRATHNRLFDTLAGLRRSIRASLSYFQTVPVSASRP